jgi:hypothetical protein
MIARGKSIRSEFAIIGIVTVLLALTAMWWSWDRVQAATRADRQLRQRQAQWKALRSAEPAPTAAVADALEQRVRQSEKAVAALKAQLGLSHTDAVRAAPVPPQRADAFFAIAQFVEAQRAAARRVGVIVPENATFSFGSYANSGPDDADLALVNRQQMVVERILGSLWAVRPLRLTRLEREDPEVKRATGESATTTTTTTLATGRRSGRMEDYFAFPAERSLARSGFVSTLAFRVGFTGKTGTLRRFLAEIDELDVPVVVRSVEVEAAGKDGRGSGGTRSLAELFRDEENPGTNANEAAEAAAVPIIASNTSEFLVVLEYLDFGAKAETDSPETSTEPEGQP